ncbi:MAG: VOC family protein [Phycisphaerales bacterium]|nr:VOC family protein [Phycisphaerales bacterium]
MPAKAIPEGFTSITPHLIIKGAAKALDFYKKAFGAEEVMRLACDQTGALMHAEIRIGNAVVMLADEFPSMGAISPSTLGGSGVTIHLYVQDVDAAFKKAVAAGATGVMPPMDMFWGDRYSKVTDPFGHTWSIATHTRDVTPQECKAAMAAMMSQPGSCN